MCLHEKGKKDCLCEHPRDVPSYAHLQDVPLSEHPEELLLCEHRDGTLTWSRLRDGTLAGSAQRNIMHITISSIINSYLIFFNIHLLIYANIRKPEDDRLCEHARDVPSYARLEDVSLSEHPEELLLCEHSDGTLTWGCRRVGWR